MRASWEFALRACSQAATSRVRGVEIGDAPIQTLPAQDARFDLGFRLDQGDFIGRIFPRPAGAIWLQVFVYI
jgi:hypothetical protein